MTSASSLSLMEKLPRYSLSYNSPRNIKGGRDKSPQPPFNDDGDDAHVRAGLAAQSWPGFVYDLDDTGDPRQFQW